MTQKSQSHHFLGYLLISFLAAIPAEAQPPVIMKLSSIHLSTIRVNPNLIPNGDFNEIGRDGGPMKWDWDHRNTDAKFRLLDTRIQTGCRTLVVTNHTPFGADVYGSFWMDQPILLKPSTAYTLSCWVSMKEPTLASIGGGDNSQLRTELPNTDGNWQRISMTFTPNPTETTFTLRLNTDGPTDGLMVRDLKLEESSLGDSAIPDGLVSHPIIWLFPPSQLNSDLPWTLHADVYAPQSLRKVMVETTLYWKNKTSKFMQKIRLPAGLSQLDVIGSGPGVADAKPTWNIFLRNSAGQFLSSSSDMIPLYSTARIRSQLLAIQEKVPHLLNLLAAIRKKGIDASYPAVYVTILQNLTPYALEILDHQQLKRSDDMLNQLEPMAARTERQLQSMLSGHLKFPPVPHYVTSPVSIVGPEFIADTRIPGQKKRIRRPVIFTGWGAFDQVRTDIEKLPGYGANIVQVELGPGAVFPSEDVRSDSAIQDFKNLCQRAARSGVAVNLLISPHYMPDWVLQKYPDLRVQSQGFLQYSLYAPEGRMILKQFLQYLIPQIMHEPALQSICLSNEPQNLEAPGDTYAQKDWYQWLHMQYGTISQLNTKWGSSYSSFKAVQLPNPINPPPPSPLWYEYVLFNQEFFAGWHKFLADTIHKIAPNIPVHAKAMTWTMVDPNGVQDGVNAELFGDFSQINGNDSGDDYNFGSGEWADAWHRNNLAYDLQHSVLDAPIFNSENHLMPDHGTYSEPPEHLRCALWQEAIHGQGATTIWTWEKTFDPKADFWGLEMERPDCVAAIGHTGLDLMRLAPQVGAFQNLKPQVQFLFTTSARVYDGDDFIDCLKTADIAMSFTGLKLGFITARDLASGRMPVAPILIVPDIQHLPASALKELERYRGFVILIGGKNVLGYNEYEKQQSHPLYTRVHFAPTKTSAQELWRELAPLLHAKAPTPIVQVLGDDNQPVWGVEWLCASYHGRRMADLANHLKRSVKVQLMSNEKAFRGKNLINEHPVNRWITLKPMQTALIISSH